MGAQPVGILERRRLMPSTYLLDTNIVSYFLRGGNELLLNRMKEALVQDRAAISVMTRAELQFGLALMPKSDKRRERIALFMAMIPTLPWTELAADRYGMLKAQLQKQGRPIGEMDTLIAAHALAEDLIFVTHNTKHFDKVKDLQLEDWMV